MLDGNALLGLALAEKHFEPPKEAVVSEHVSPLTHKLAIVELLYILRRKASMDIAKQMLDLLRGSGLINIIPTDMFFRDNSTG